MQVEERKTLLHLVYIFTDVGMGDYFGDHRKRTEITELAF